MFAAPPKIEMIVHAKLPAHMRHAGRQTEWTKVRSDLGMFPNIDSFLEGPSFDREGNLHIVNICFGQIVTLTAAGEWKVTSEYDGEPNGLAIHKDGRFFVADSQWGIVVVDPISGKAEHYLTRTATEHFRGCNDLTFASNGDLYFTDQGDSGLNNPNGRVFRLRGNGQLDLLLDNVPSPNGLALSPDERTLFVAVTRGNCIWRVPLNPDGSVYRAGLFIQLSGSLGGPDGVAIDINGGIAIAHVQFGTVWVFDGFGEPTFRLNSPTGRTTTNLCYGGPENKTVFVMESGTGTILRADVTVPGLRLYSHQ